MPTGIQRGDDGSILLGCEGHTGHLANPAAADGEDGFFIALTCLFVSTTLPPPPIVVDPLLGSDLLFSISPTPVVLSTALVTVTTS